MVNHGPAMISPAIVSRMPVRNAWIWPGVVVRAAGLLTNQASSPSPASSGSSRHTLGRFGVTRRVTPSGEMLTRRRAIRAATAAATGTPKATASDVCRAERQVAGEERRAGERDLRAPGRSRKNSPNPAATPITAATLDSTAEMIAICRGVAPTSRIAAKRCSRRLADSRVAVPMKIRTGNSSAAATTDSTRSMPLASMPMS